MEIIEIPRIAKKGHRNSNSRVGKEAGIARSHRFLSLPLTSHYSCWTLSWLKRTFPPATLNSFNLLETGHGLQTRRGIDLVVMQMFMTKITKMVRRRKSPIPIHLQCSAAISIFPVCHWFPHPFLHLPIVSSLFSLVYLSSLIFPCTQHLHALMKEHLGWP